MTTYRADIDGLRALAIVPVVLFHAGVPGFSGGYVGVDVFFVISGFLITSIIRDEMANGRFTVGGFYERRARRILPALFAMMATSAVLAAWILYPHQFLAFSRSVIAASLFSSSFLFRSEAGYFDLDSEQKPLLHTWSLSVEEIFYIVFPILLLSINRHSHYRQAGVLVCIALLSLMTSSIALSQDPKSPSAFFLPYSRAWELILGALLAYGLLPSLGGPQREGTALLGIAMILTAVLAYSANTIFPGTSALLPCLGAALVIYSGQHGGSLAGRLLSMPSMIWVGRISYSLYLWHWPLLVFARAKLGDTLSPLIIGAIIALSVLLAEFSTRFIESPFRRPHATFERRQIFQLSATGIVLFAAAGLYGVWTDGWSSRYPPNVARILFAQEDRDPRYGQCLNRRATAQGNGCIYGDDGAQPTVALWGDSHAAVYSAMLGELAAKRNQSVLALTMPACPPLDGWALKKQAWHDECLGFQRRAIQRILETPSIRIVLLAGRFAGYPIGEPDSGFESAMRETIRRLRLAGKRVFVVYPVPEPGENIPIARARALEQGKLLEDGFRSASEFHETFFTVHSFLDQLVANEEINAIKPSEILCDRWRCFYYRDGVVFFYDEHHLSMSGANQLKTLFSNLFQSP